MNMVIGYQRDTTEQAQGPVSKFEDSVSGQICNRAKRVLTKNCVFFCPVVDRCMPINVAHCSIAKPSSMMVMLIVIMAYHMSSWWSSWFQDIGNKFLQKLKKISASQKCDIKMVLLVLLLLLLPLQMFLVLLLLLLLLLLVVLLLLLLLCRRIACSWPIACPSRLPRHLSDTAAAQEKCAHTETWSKGAKGY